MSNWRMVTITDETIAALPQSRYHRMGGWLLVFAIFLCGTCLLWLFSLVQFFVRMGGNLFTAIVAPGSSGEVVPLSPWFVISFLIVGLPTASGVLSFLWLMQRKIAFRAPFAVHAVFIFFCMYFGLFNSIRSFLYVCLLLAWLLYVNRSDRVRVFCNCMPIRPVPLPIEEGVA